MKITPIPPGTKDVLPAEAAELRHLRQSIRAVFDSFGYGEVITPTLETEAALETAGEKRFRNSFRLFDERGEVLVLRPEMTTPIARVVATRMADREPPIRLCYFAGAFSPISPQRGRQSEFRQAGLELIGLGEPAVDAEVLAVLCRALDACGLVDYSVGLGEASFFRALLESAGVSGESRDEIFAALVERDMVRLSAAVASLDAAADDKTAIMDVIALRGGSEVLRRAQDLVRGPRMEAALKRLARTYYLVSRYGLADRILFDLGMFRNFDYYTGIVFEVYSGDLGFPIGGGGRYDGLLARFGRPAPAVGFAIGLDRLHIAVTGQGGVRAAVRPSVALIGGLEPELDLANQLRGSGMAVYALPAGIDEAAALALAADAGSMWLAVPAGESDFRLIRLPARAQAEPGTPGGAGGRLGPVLKREDLVRELTA